MHIFALYESVTNRIIEEMNVGTVPWPKPWKSGKTIGAMPKWIELLKEYPRVIFAAASKTAQAADYLRRFSEVIQGDVE